MSTESPLPADHWDYLPPAGQALILALQGEVSELQTQIPALQHLVQGLQDQMNQSTARASQAPSPDASIVSRPPSSSLGGEIPTAESETSPCDRLRELVHQSPRTFGKPRSTWTLQLLAKVCFETGIVNQQVSASTVRRELRRMGIRWKRTKLWAPSPDPQYALKKARRDRLIEVAAKHPDWVLGFVDEVWWSRLQRPRMQAWADGGPLKMHVLKSDASDPDPIAICCYGMLRNDTKKVRASANFG